MKATELMIGDWVEVTNSDYLKFVQVDGILGNSIFTKEAEYESEEIDINDLRTIPLTSEILEKNGFKRLQDTYLFNITTNQFGVNLWLEIGPDSWIENNKICVDSLKGDFNYPMLTIMSCKYVHEFQHLLKLFRIKKDIVL